MRPRKIILCVDQNETALGIRKFLLETRGYRVIGAIGAQQAIDAFTAQRPDLVLTELVLPGIDGNELVRNLKAIAYFVPMIISSPFPRPLTTHHADGFLSKTADVAELLERIKVLLIRKRGPKKFSQRFAAPDQIERSA